MDVCIVAVGSLEELQVPSAAPTATTELQARRELPPLVLSCRQPSQHAKMHRPQRSRRGRPSRRWRHRLLLRRRLDDCVLHNAVGHTA